ncbi:pilus assembly protein [Pseudomonas sp. TE3610]
MRALTLDFQPHPRFAGLGWCLLAAAVALAAGCLVAQQQMDAQTVAQQHELHQARQQLGDDNAASLKASLTPAQVREQEQNLAEMRKVSQQLRRPWERLFAMLEGLPRTDIALLALTPDAHKGQVRITAQARNLEAMLAFHRQLEASDELSDVSLLNHEIDAEAPEHPVQFNLSATWEINDGAQ